MRLSSPSLRETQSLSVEGVAVLQLLPRNPGRWAWPRKEGRHGGAGLSGHALDDDCDALATSDARRPNTVFLPSAPEEESRG